MEIHKKWREEVLRAAVMPRADCWAAQVGPDFPLMLDCYMALTVPYAIKLCNALAPHGLKWMEEFLPPDNYEGYKEVLQLHARCKLSIWLR